MRPGPLDLDDLIAAGQDQTIGRQIQLLNSVSSTNDVVLEHAKDRENHGLVVFAESQTRGRGRLRRTWESPMGASVLCSTLLILESESTEAQSILLWTTLAARDALVASAHIDAHIKWPNDLLVRGKKICGILIESQAHDPQTKAFALGIGINCLQHARHFPPELRDKATSLDLESPEPVNRLQVAGALLAALEHWYIRAQRSTQQELVDSWFEHVLSFGKRVRLSCEGQTYSGSLIEIDPQAGILVELDHGVRRLFSPFTTTIEEMD